MLLITKPISIIKLQTIAKQSFGNLVKAVIDLRKEIIVIDADLHSDQEQYLLERGSKQYDLWGINLYPYKNRKEILEFDSMINVRPKEGNMSRSVEDESIRKKIVTIVNNLIAK